MKDIDFFKLKETKLKPTDINDHHTNTGIEKRLHTVLNGLEDSFSAVLILSVRSTQKDMLCLSKYIL